MAVTQQRTATRIRFTDEARKAMATFSGINPDVTAGGAKLFANAFANLQNGTLGHIFLIKEDELTESQ